MLVFLDSSTLTTGDIDLTPLESFGKTQIHATSADEEITNRIDGAEIVLTNKAVLDVDVLSSPQAASLKLICVVATGVNNVDLETAREKGITVCNVSGYSTTTVAQHTIAMLLSLATNLHRYAAEAPMWSRSPIFTRLDHPVVELDDKLLGIAGLGSIGGRVGEIAQALGMQVQCLAREGSLNSRHPEWPRVDHETFFSTSDAITLHCPLTSETENMIDGETLALMKPSAFLINTGRGGLVHELALVEALKDKRIAGAATDVLSEEPPSANHPLLAAAQQLPNLIVTPHSAWTAHESRQRLFDLVIENIAAFLSGDPRNVVT